MILQQMHAIIECISNEHHLMSCFHKNGILNCTLIRMNTELEA
jgi:hypothetical protein